MKKTQKDRVTPATHPGDIPKSYCPMSALVATAGYNRDTLRKAIARKALPAMKLKRSPTDIRGVVYVHQDTAIALLAERLAASKPAAAPAAPTEVTDTQVLDAIGRLFDKVDQLCFDFGVLHEAVKQLTTSHENLSTLVECMDADVVRLIDKADTPRLPADRFDDVQEVRGDA